MAHYKTNTKENKAILESIQTNYNTQGVSFSHPKRIIGTDGTIKEQRVSGSISIDSNPTSNCQLASIRGFYSNLSQFKKNIKTKPIEEKLELWNNKVRKMALLKALYVVNRNVTAKRQYFIDIPKSYTSYYHEFSPWACVKRDPKREVVYHSTNGSTMMYTIMQVDIKKLEKYK